MDPTRSLSRRTIEGLIAAGHLIVIRNKSVMQLDAWLDNHPGGKLSIQHMVGRDATDEINAYHSMTAIRLMNKYRIGRIDGPWTNFTPPIRGGVFREAVDKEDVGTDTDGETDTDSTSSSASFNSSTTSLNLVDDVDDGQSEPAIALPTKSLETSSSIIGMSDRGVKHRCNIINVHERVSQPSISSAPRSREEYISSVLQQEIEDNKKCCPSLDPEVQRQIAVKYQRLHNRVKKEGFYDCNYVEYGKELTRYTFLFVMFAVCLRAEWYMTSATFLGLFWHQIMFTAHDAGHRGITHNFVIDTLIGIFIADVCCGMSIGWWKCSHNVHHLVTNQPDHDPDLQNVPLFATSSAYFRSIKSTYYDGFIFVWDAFADFAVRYQTWTYYPIMAIARFNLYVLSWAHLLSPRSANLGCAAWTRPVEVLGIMCYWLLYGYCLLWLSIPTWKLRTAFVVMSHMVTAPLHVQITLSHWAMPSADIGDGESFAQRQLRTTMDVQCPPWLDFIHGGLQFQAVHHLFPRVPRHNLRKLQVLVREFCQETGIEYNILGFVDGNKKVIGRLQEISSQVEMMIKCQKYMAATGESGLH